MSRLVALAPELSLGLALAVAFAAVLAPGPRAGRVAHRAVTWGGAAAAMAALATSRHADDFLFLAWPVDGFSQLSKALVAAGLVWAGVRGARDAGDWGHTRAAGPFMQLAAGAALVVAAGSADLLVAWTALHAAALALITACAVSGRWSGLERLVRAQLTSWSAAVVASLASVPALALLAGGTRYAGMWDVFPDPARQPVVMGALLALLVPLLWFARHAVWRRRSGLRGPVTLALTSGVVAALAALVRLAASTGMVIVRGLP